MADRYPCYDVLTKRHTPSWNARTREVIDARLAVYREPRFFTAAEWRTLHSLCERILPQPPARPPVPLPAYVDEKLHTGQRDGYRYAQLPAQEEAWRRGLAALEAESQAAHGTAFTHLTPTQQDELLCRMQHGQLTGPAWPRGYVRMGLDRRDPWEAPPAQSPTAGTGSTQDSSQ